ncbi:MULTISPECIES: hypothetical protein [Staphylococcaceae]|uniref:RGS domain-containing protein n=1 Tax=Mammaliicoccus sciuri TaxID=1296 RepID=A0AAW5LN54_MAMSC|nr:MULTISPECIES: hypothetical protein [Staphylococcus]MCQ9303602.1 hypothetical protein [Mammaliicoccus sciuri]MDG0822696.1 hypothetical protein [Staphylococcus equorum]PTK18354.1 hypothetical protein BUZ72_09950 [Staphylococcus saprophyticus]
MNKNIEGLKATENTIYMRYTVHIDDQIINNVKECIKKFEVLPMEDKIPLSPLLQPEYAGEVQDIINTYEQFMINFGKVMLDSQGVKVKIESESLISIQQGIQEQCYSNKRTNDIDVTKEWYLCKFLNQISEEDKNQLYESLKKLMNDSKNKKQAFQEVFKIYNDIYIYNKEKAKYDYQVSSYFNLIQENPKITYKKRHLQEKQGVKGTTFTNKLKLLKKMYDVDVAKYQPFYNSNNPEYEIDEFDGRYITQRSNYEFNRLQYQAIEILSKVLDKHPLPKSDNNYKHNPTIEKAILRDDSHSFYEYFEDIMKEIMNMDNSPLQEKLLTDFTYQSQCRWYSENKKLKLQLESFMHKVLESNYYEGSKLLRTMSNAIEETINEADEDKSRFNCFKDYFLTDGEAKNWELISENISKFNGKVIKIIQKKYEKLQSNNINRKQNLKFDYLYHCFEFSNNVVKAKDNESKNYILFFVDKYKIKTPFLDQLLINCLNQEIGQESINYNMQTMFEKERYDRSSTIEKLVATSKFKYEKDDADLFKQLFNDVENSIDRLGIYLLNNGINSNDENARYYRSFLKELSRIKSKLMPFSLEISKSSGREQHYPDDVADDKDERRKNKEETYHAFDDKNDIDSKLKNKINVSIDNLLSVKIRSNLYDISPNTKKQ